jgi:hypothetical protein
MNREYAMETNTTPIKEEAVKAAIDKTVRTLLTTGGAPSGHLYVDVMDVLSLDQWLRLLNLLEAKGFVKTRGHYVTWTGPTEVRISIKL